MDAEAECQVAIRLAPDVEAIRVGKLAGIAVRGADSQVEDRAGFELLSPDLGVDREPAVAELVRALEAQELVDRVLDARGVFA